MFSDLTASVIFYTSESAVRCYTRHLWLQDYMKAVYEFSKRIAMYNEDKECNPEIAKVSSADHGCHLSPLAVCSRGQHILTGPCHRVLCFTALNSPLQLGSQQPSDLQLAIVCRAADNVLMRGRCKISLWLCKGCFLNQLMDIDVTSMCGGRS